MSTDRSSDGATYQFTVIRDKMRQHSGPVLDFALGRRHQPPPDWLSSFVSEHAGLVLRRRTDDELDALIAAAAAMLDRVYDAKVSRTSILPAPGGRAAMTGLAAVLIAPGDGVLVTEPGYPAIARIAAQSHARVTAVPLRPEKGFAPDLDALTGDDDIGLAALNYPNNPTGGVLSAAAFDALRRRLGSAAVIYNDAIYGPLTYQRPPWSLLADEFGGADVIELHSLGKLFALGPLGLAFLVGPERQIAPIRQYSDFSWAQLSSLQVRVATKCLKGWDHVATVRDGLRDRVDRLRAVVADLGFDPYPTEAGMYLLCRAPTSVDGRQVASAAEAAEVLLADHGLAVAPWDVEPNSYIRFSAQYRDEDLEALAALGAALNLEP